jgi:hypothetical protein
MQSGISLPAKTLYYHNFNFFMNDTGDLEITQIGEFYNLKVKAIKLNKNKI